MVKFLIVEPSLLPIIIPLGSKYLSGGKGNQFVKQNTKVTKIVKY